MDKLPEGKADRTIILTVDSNHHSERALRWYMQNFHKEGDSLILYHPVETPQLPVLKFIEESYQERLGESIATIHEEIQKLTQKSEAVRALTKILSKSNFNIDLESIVIFS